jgi:hypothetical protein
VALLSGRTTVITGGAQGIEIAGGADVLQVFEAIGASAASPPQPSSGSAARPGEGSRSQRQPVFTVSRTVPAGLPAACEGSRPEVVGDVLLAFPVVVEAPGRGGRGALALLFPGWSLVIGGRR